MTSKRRYKHSQKCAVAGCESTWMSKLPQTGSILYCHKHQLQFGVSNPVSPAVHATLHQEVET